MAILAMYFYIFLAVQTVSETALYLPPVPDYKDLLLFYIEEWPERLVTFETYDQSDKETWPDQKKYHDKDKDNDKDKYI